ncbi:MAG: alpha/beta hydrolase, partial [Burkholderiaceae bacterium]|nr:alpha/beta hydrolase [Burkholderiaceae bacterium]
MASRAFRAGLPIEQHRRRVRQAVGVTFPPRGTKFTIATCGGVTPLTFLYLHGGGYLSGSPVTHRAITGHLASRCGARVFAADYRLAPEHPFPAGLDDAVAAYRGLLAEGVLPGGLVIAGDSAGGGLTAATALRLRELALPLPRALVLFSPWTDLTLEQLSPAAGEVMLNQAWLQDGARDYVAHGDARDPLV